VILGAATALGALPACGSSSGDTSSTLPSNTVDGPAAIVTAAPGGSPASTAEPRDPGDRPTIDVLQMSSNSPLPDVVVIDVAKREWVQLKNLLPRRHPLLVWFWAPH
jgi:hypothetical protein